VSIYIYWDPGRNSNIKVSILRKNKRPLDYRYATKWCKSRLSFRAINPYNLQPVS
jgi:hypothetical protein